MTAHALPSEAAKNWNMLAASLLIAAWRRLGVSTYFISPGYRDAPLIAALQARSDVELVSCFDERAGAFQALGYAKATGLPAVLICTSGTAGANYYPALIEASVEQVPMLVVTADRPFELVHAAAQQVVDQRQIYGRFAKKSLDFPVPSKDFDGRAWMDVARDLLQTALAAPQGPVHLNVPFHVPLDPVQVKDGPGEVEAWDKELRKMPTQIARRERPPLDAASAALFRNAVGEAKRGFLLLGRFNNEKDRQAARFIQEKLGWPSFADVGSGLKGMVPQQILDLQHPLMLEALSSYRPDMIIHLGRRLVSRYFDDFIARHEPASYWVFSSEIGPQDPAHLLQRLQFDSELSSVAVALADLEIKPPPADLAASARSLVNKLATMEPGEFNFAAVAETIIELSPREDHGLFLGNSTAIRAFDSWCYAAGAWPEIQANRGVSGIEGLLATALGVARGKRQGWTVVLGDISMMHDLNSILSLKTSGLTGTFIVVIVNNSGGRIFETLPIAAYPEVKDPWISTPHTFNFEGIAAMAGVDYIACQSQKEFEHAYGQSLKTGGMRLIECRQSPDADRLYQNQLRHLTSQNPRIP